MLLRDSYKALALSGLFTALFAADAKRADACGGCFIPPTETVTSVNEHRMVFSISKTQTVLWDQIKYSGNPKEFAWVLPVRQGTKIQLSHDEFMTALDAYTAPVIVGPTPKSSGTGVGCGSAVSNAFDPGGGGVQVVSDQVVGPYEAVTLRASNGDSLNTWLTTHQFAIPQAIQPVIDSYVKGGFDFIALRLLPGQGIGSMQPVRVVSQGADPTLPLRMVAAGVGEKVGVLLYVIGEGRYDAAKFRNITIADDQILWDSTKASSNYADLAESLMVAGDGKGVLTEFAGHAFVRDFATVNTFGGSFGGLDQAYKAAQQQSLSASKCAKFPAYDSGSPQVDSGGPAFDASMDDASASDASDDGSAGDAATDDAGSLDAGADDAGTTSDPCNFDDLDVATAGMAPADVWVTRLRMHLPVSALADDLTVEPEATQALYSNVHYAVDQQTNGGCAQASTSSSDWVGGALGALGLGLLVRRRRRAGR